MDFNWNDIADTAHIMEMIPGGVYFYRPDENDEGEVIAINKTALHIYGFSDFTEFKQTIGSSVKKMVHPADVVRVYESIRKQLESSIGEKHYYLEYRIIRADGKTRLVSEFGKLVHSEKEGDVFCVFVDDASEKISRATKSLAPQFFKIVKVNLTRDAFVTLKQPENDYLPTSKKFSSDVSTFTKKGFLHDDDIAYFSGIVNLESLRNYFQKGGTNKVLRYRRKILQSFCWTTMTITRAEEYTEDNQIVTMFERIADDNFVSLHDDYKKAEIIAGLASGFDSIYILNTEKNIVSPYILATPLSQKINTALLNQYEDYSVASSNYARKFIVPSDRQQYLLKTSVDYILRMLTHSRRYEVVFRAFNSENQNIYLQLSVCRIDENNLTRVLLGYKNITKQFTEETDRTVSSHVNEILHFLADDYVFLNEIDIETETEKQFFLNEEADFAIPKWSDSTDFRECITAFARKYVAPHDLERFTEATRMENLRKVLSEKKSFVITYDVVVRGVQRRFEGHFVLQKSASGKEKILVGTQDITQKC